MRYSESSKSFSLPILVKTFAHSDNQPLRSQPYRVILKYLVVPFASVFWLSICYIFTDRFVPRGMHSESVSNCSRFCARRLCSFSRFGRRRGPAHQRSQG